MIDRRRIIGEDKEDWIGLDWIGEDQCSQDGTYLTLSQDIARRLMHPARTYPRNVGPEAARHQIL